MESVKINAARELLTEKNYGQAVLVANDLLTSQPNSLEAFWILATAYYEMGDDESAEKYLVRYLRDDRKSIDATLRLAKCVKRQGRITESLNLLKALLTKNDTQNLQDDVVLAELSGAYLEQGDSDQAMLYGNKALLVNSSNFLAHMVLGSVFILLGTPKEALKYLLNARDMRSSDPQVHINLASAYELMGNNSGQLECLNMALMCDNRLSALLPIIANLQIKLGNFIAAEETLLRYLEIDPENTDARLIVTDLYLSGEKYSNAIEHGLYLVKQNPNQLAAWKCLERGFQLTEQVEKVNKCRSQIDRLSS